MIDLIRDHVVSVVWVVAVAVLTAIWQVTEWL